MTIINTKVSEEANQENNQIIRRETEENTARHDSIWTQAPPAYEEVADSVRGIDENGALEENLPSIQGPTWSETIETSRQSWLSPNIPQYTCHTTFSLPANAKTFVRAYGIGYTGWLRIGSSNELTEKEWKEINDDTGLDRIGVMVQARFTHRHLLDLVNVEKVGDERDPQKIIEGLCIKAQDIPTRGNVFLNFTITIYLPEPIYRTPSGLARDGSSHIPFLDLFADNLLIVLEAFNENGASVSFSHLVANAKIAGISLKMNLRANESIVLLSETGHISDLSFSGASPLTIAAPKVTISSLNGPIQISTILSMDEIDLSTINGGINVSHVAIAKKVSCSSRDGALRGQYNAFNTLSLKTITSDVCVGVIVSKDSYQNLLKNSGLLAIVDSTRAEQFLGGLTSTTSWRKLEVNAFTQVGSASVEYIDQDRETELVSQVTSMTGSVNVSHSRLFEGKVEFETTIGSITVHEPDQGKYEKRKTFVVDLGGDEGRQGKYVQGRVFSIHPGWQALGPDREYASPISHSRMYSNIGRIESAFA